MTKKTIHVVAAVICNEKQEVLIAKRPTDAHQGGLWEFPGGKVESGEMPAQALIRELQEELNITATHYSPLIQIHHNYSDKSVFLDVWKVTRFTGNPIGEDGVGAEGQPVQWVPSCELDMWQFPAANAAIVKAAQLPSDYVITPEVDSFSASVESANCIAEEGEEELFIRYIENVLLQGYKLIQLRTKSLDKEPQVAITSKVLGLCQQYDAVLMLNSDLQNLPEGEELCDISLGLHLTGDSLRRLKEKPSGYRFVAASCHGGDDVLKAEKLGLEFVTLSPVLKTLSHPEAETLGWDMFAEMVREARMPVYALGGMTLDSKGQALANGAQGIASIGAYLEFA